MSHIQYTLRRSGRYYYNRRVPKHAVQSYGSFIRLALSKDPVEAAAYAKRLVSCLVPQSRHFVNFLDRAMKVTLELTNTVKIFTPKP